MPHQSVLFDDPAPSVKLLIGLLFDRQAQMDLALARQGWDWVHARLPHVQRLHLTLHCLHVHPGRVASVMQVLADVALPPLQLSLRHVERWGRIAVIRPDPDAALCALREQLTFRLLGAGLRVDGHWTPHVTLAWEAENAKLLRPVSPVCCRFSEFVLIDSRFFPRPEHRILARYPARPEPRHR